MNPGDPILYAAVLAGGLSTRMGEDKRFLRIDGERWVDRALRIAREAIGGAGDRVLLCGEVPGLACLPDPGPRIGPLGGLLSAMRRIRAETPDGEAWLLVMPVDMPLLEPALLAPLHDALPRARAESWSAIGFEGHEMPLIIHCAGPTLETLERLCQAPGPMRSLRALQALLKSKKLELRSGALGAMLNVNRPEDQDELENRLEKRANPRQPSRSHEAAG